MVRLPCRGVKNSLNVACCASIVLYEARTLADGSTAPLVVVARVSLAAQRGMSAVAGGVRSRSRHVCTGDVSGRQLCRDRSVTEEV